jgi:hypothetical protein
MNAENKQTETKAIKKHVMKCLALNDCENPERVYQTDQEVDTEGLKKCSECGETMTRIKVEYHPIKSVPERKINPTYQGFFGVKRVETIENRFIKNLKIILGES